MIGWVDVEARAPTLVQRLLPGLTTLRQYHRGWLRGDVLAGITVAAYLVPQVMAYAGIAGLPPEVGLWAIMAPLAVYAFVGSSKQLSVGPESTTALMTATAVAPLALGDSGRYAALAAALALLVALFCLLAWALRVGFIADLLSWPVLIGYMAGVAVIMIISQLEKLTGIPVDGETLIAEVRSFLTHLADLHWPTLAVGLGVLVFLLLVQHFWPKAPGPLLAVLLATAVVALFGLGADGVAVVGTIPGGLPQLARPDVGWSDLQALFLPALGVMIVGYTDNVLTGRAFAAKSDYDIDANQELLALSASNLGAGFFQGFPVSSSGSRTAIGHTVGSRTQLYSLVALASVVVVLLFLRPVLAQFPQAALGGIVVYAATRLVDVPAFRRLRSFRRSEYLLALGALAGVLLLDILYGVLIAVGLSVLDLLRRVARPHDAVQGLVPGLAGMHDVDDFPQAQTIPGLVVYRYDSPLFFANAEDFKRRALDAVDQQPWPARWFVLNAEANVEVDLTAVDALIDLRTQLAERGIVFAMARVKQDLLVLLDRGGLVQQVGSDLIFPTLPTAVAGYQAWAKDHPVGS
jgi:high affinity sulfate transporter 1